MDDQAGRILALESTLADAQRSLTVHDLLLRAVLTHLALREPAEFQALVQGFAKASTRRLDGAMTPDVAEILAAMFEEVASSMPERR